MVKEEIVKKELERLNRVIKAALKEEDDPIWVADKTEEILRDVRILAERTPELKSLHLVDLDDPMPSG